MKKKDRILKNREFSSIISKKRSIRTPSFVIYTQPRKGGQARVGISVGKKLGNAVCRNKVKRQVRSMVDSIFNFNEDYDTILIVRPVYARHTFQENSDELAKAKRQLDNKKKGNTNDSKIS